MCYFLERIGSLSDEWFAILFRRKFVGRFMLVSSVIYFSACFMDRQYPFV